jgi:hypothetical protein
MRELPPGVLPADTARAWRPVAETLPAGAYLAGGTALAVALAHRESRDLDIFVPTRFNTGQIAANLAQAGTFTVTSQDDDTTLNGYLDGARVQFLYAHGQRNLDPPMVYEHMPVAGVRDVLAMKLKVIGDRGALRDYFDIMLIEQLTTHRMEQGIGYYTERYGLDQHHSSITHIARCLTSFDDVEPDPTIPDSEAISRYFLSRHRAVLESLPPHLKGLPGISD